MIANNTETHILQRAFRNIMNSLARPGLLGEVEPFSRAENQEEYPLPACFETVVRTLVDQAVTFAVSGMRQPEATQWVTLKTRSHSAELEEANFILIPDVANSLACRDAILKAFEGTLIAPEKGATIILGCRSLAGTCIPGASTSFVDPGDKTYRVVVSGPGIKDTHEFFVDRADWIEARKDRNDEYPCGIDLILIDEEGHVVGIPRTTKIFSVEKEGAAWDM